MINLTKGGNINLSKEAAGITVFRMGLAWDVNTNGGADFDLDAAAIPCKEDGKAVSSDHFVSMVTLTGAMALSSIQVMSVQVLLQVTMKQLPSIPLSCLLMLRR